MSSIPLPALSIKPVQIDPIQEFARIFQIKGMQQSQQLQAAQLQGVQTENQAKQLALQQETLATKDDQTWRNLMHDPNWDGTSDWLLKKGAPLVGPASLKTVAQGFAAMGEQWAKLGKEQLGVQDALGNHIGDQLQSVVDSKPEDKLAAQQAAKQNAVTWINSTPGVHPAVRQEMLQGLQTIPDDKYIGDDAIKEHIAQTKLHAAIVDEGLKTAQTTQAAGKGAQAQAEADKIAAQQDPQSPIYSPSPAAVAIGTAPGAQAIATGEAKQAGAKAGAEAAARSAAEFPYQQRLEQMRQGGSPVYAFDPKQNATVLTTKEEAQQNGMQAVRKVSEGDIAKDTQMQRQLGDAQLNVSAYRMSSQKMDELSGSEIARVGDLLGTSGFKAHFLGAELPSDWANELRKNQDWTKLPPDAREAVESYIGARGAIIAYAKAISGSGRLTESQLQTEMQNLPSPASPSDVREKQFDRFQRNIDQAASGLPKIPGVDSPAAIRARIEGQAADEQATRAKIQAAEDSKSGQYSDPQKQHTVGEELIYKGQWRKVSKIYKDGSFDME